MPAGESIYLGKGGRGSVRRVNVVCGRGCSSVLCLGAGGLSDLGKLRRQSMWGV
jgi:hypothetical protein